MQAFNLKNKMKNLKAECQENKIIQTLELVSQSNYGTAFNNLSREQMISVQDEVENLY